MSRNFQELLNAAITSDAIDPEISIDDGVIKIEYSHEPTVTLSLHPTFVSEDEDQTYDLDISICNDDCASPAESVHFLIKCLTHFYANFDYQLIGDPACK